MKSFFRAVKCFFLSEPFAPQVDLCCPSLRGLARVHERCKWITNKKHFRQGKMISWGNFLQVENGTLFNDNWNCVFSVKKTVKKTISSSFSSLVEKTVKKNPKTVKSVFQPMKKKLEKHEVIPVRIEQMLFLAWKLKIKKCFS